MFGFNASEATTVGPEEVRAKSNILNQVKSNFHYSCTLTTS